jgi:hypothetical protein
MTSPKKPQPDLALIQQWMQAVIMNPEGVEEGIASRQAQDCIPVEPGDAEKVIARSKALTSVERLEIYNRAYYARLLECLREEFPALMHALGEEAFDAFAVGYLQKYPSKSYTLVELGRRFPQFLAETQPQADESDQFSLDWPEFLIDLATLELTFNEVFDGPGTEREPLMDPEQLQKIGAEQWPDAHLETAPCLRLLALRFPVHRYFSAVRRKQDPELPDRTETFLAVSRQNYVVRHYELSAPSFQILNALVAGESVGEAIERGLGSAGDDVEALAAKLQEWFRDWAAEGFFRAVRLAGDNQPDAD